MNTNKRQAMLYQLEKNGGGVLPASRNSQQKGQLDSLMHTVTEMSRELTELRESVEQSRQLAVMLAVQKGVPVPAELLVNQRPA